MNEVTAMLRRHTQGALRACVVWLVLVSAVSLARADGLASLENFLRTVKTARADFTQVVTPPAREGQAARSKTSSGTFEFQRPDRFRFQYRKPFEQTLVADGSTLWMHDVDLNQVTARPQAQALGSTPVALLAGASDLSALRRDFTLSNAPDAAGLQWAEAVPKARDGTLRRVRIGFNGGTLSTLDIEDSFGQRSVLTFSALQLNVPIEAQRLRFAPPAGADVMRP